MYNSRINDYALETEKIRVYRKGEVPSNVLSKAEFERKSVIKRLREFYRLEASSSNPQDFTEFFSYPIRYYFGRSNLDKTALVHDRYRYIRNWPNRRYSLRKIEIIDQNMKENSCTAEATFTYTLSNGAKEISGMSRQRLKMRKIGGRYLIEEIMAMR
jgi:hypothetical protein